ncbi:hypothetical protein DMC30DRAFT_6766 [Rhodotorula diobovata]|uniref:Uncharacterized protein n=1 Tax=Rhodotorula diobovata TaxID=5288 RepID=A0A5C5G6M4_9BASI|nr:hypothetical protein DMC30DRAFT_6766 [Rhodotorula diobovata]
MAQVGLGFAGSSDEEDEEDRRELELARRAAADAAMDAVPMSAGVSGSGGSEHDAPATKGFAGASDDEDDEAAKPAPTAALGFAADSDEDDAPVLAPNAALGFAAESGEQEARGFAGDSNEVGDKDEDEAMVAAPAAAAGAQAPIALGFADDDDADDEDDDMGFAEAALAPLPQTQTAAAPSRDDVPVPSVKQRKQEQPDQDSATQPAQRPASAVKGTEPTAEEPAGHPTPPVREEPAGQPTPPVRPHKRPSQDDAAPPKFHKVAKVVKPSSTAQARPSKDRSTTPDETPRPPLPKKRVSLDAQQRDKKKKRKKVIADDSEEEAREMSPPVLTQAQLKSLKIAKVGQKHPAPPASAPAATKQAPIAVAVAAAPAQQLAVASGPDRSHQSPPVSNESSSLGSGAQARKARDIFNHGVVRPTSLNGYVRLNGDWLRQKKLSAELTRGETVRYPADVVSEVDKIRHLWSIRPGGHLIEGVRDFDEAMHLVDERGQRRAREAYVTKPPEEGKAERDKRARQHLNDYHALQLVLSSIDGVKQAEEPKESVTAVFVHASELGQVGRFSGHLKQLEQFRMNEDAVCFSYGEGENRKRAMEPFWRPLTTAFTFTPAAFVRNPARISHLVEKAREAYVPGSCLRAQFPWAPLHYILPGGPFGRADDVVGPHLDLDKNELVNVKSRPHKLGYLKQLPFTWITPRNPSSLKALRFPDKGDHSEYNDRDCHMLSKMPPSKHCALDLEGLQKLVCQWRARYPRIRRWMIIATPDELDKCATAFPGVRGPFSFVRV